MEKQNHTDENKTTKANEEMNKVFQDLDYRGDAKATSQTEKANIELQKEFYGRDDDAPDTQAFYVDANTPPLKK